LSSVPGIVRWRPARDELGRPSGRTIVALTSEHTAPNGIDAAIPVPRSFASALRSRDRIMVTDTRGRRRELNVTARHVGWVETETAEGAYVLAGARIEAWRRGRRIASAAVGALPRRAVALRLAIGDELLITPIAEPASAAHGRHPARISCTLPEALHAVRAGQRVLLHDGKICGKAKRVDARGVLVTIESAPKAGAWLRADQGINLPDTDLHLPALTERDREDTKIVTRFADLIGLSFVNDAADVLALHRLLDEHGCGKRGIVLKIETGRGFARLPSILLAALRRPRAAVMVARGDLAVEVGFERLSEVQEEILWLCEAAHIPTIWGTQVLERLVKKGQPTRAEVTDAAMSQRAECVMLNKGPEQVNAVRFLADVLKRMRAHHAKKRSQLRALSVSRWEEALPNGVTATRREAHAPFTATRTATAVTTGG
jgi:pyruvate kinase